MLHSWCVVSVSVVCCSCYVVVVGVLLCSVVAVLVCSVSCLCCSCSVVGVLLSSV